MDSTQPVRCTVVDELWLVDGPGGPELTRPWATLRSGGSVAPSLVTDQPIVRLPRGTVVTIVILATDSISVDFHL